jgi:hypothetical protein
MLALGGDGHGKIDEANYPTVISHINLGLTALFTRFTLREGRVLLRPVPGQLVYALDSDFAINNIRSRQDVRYLIDTPTDKFDEDTLIKVEKVLDDSDAEQPLGLRGEPTSFHLPSIKSIRLPKDWKGDVTLVYRQNHPQIVIPVGYFDPNRVEVELPYTHLEALLYYVASRVHNPIGLQAEFHMGNSYAAKYEQACAMLERDNIQVDAIGVNDRFTRGGWV